MGRLVDVEQAVMWTWSKAQTVWRGYSVPAKSRFGFVPTVSVKPSYICHYFTLPQNAFLSRFAVVCTVT
jgi:hypothetical protein